MQKFQDVPDPRRAFDVIGQQAEIMTEAFQKRASHNQKTLETHMRSIGEQMQSWSKTLTSPAALTGAWKEYAQDTAQRMVLFADAMRQYGDTIKAHNDAGAPPVLVYDSEMVMDGADLPRPCNYFLLRLLPLDDAKIDDTKRPIVIVDPRAGHGGGIGGFKPDSQVGVAFRNGHPVYFVAFHQEPIPHQTIAMVTDAEAAFIREVERLHPQSPKPIVVGNCQGGWATAILAATNPDLTGSIVLNGAPMSYWAGKVGQDLMRYSGGLAGGALPAMMAGDAAGGIFDGADLVQNFEALNPARNWFGKYFDLYQNVDTGVQRFLDFERWWGGFYLLTTEEITWIVENLFVGNKLSKNTAQLEPGRPIDLKNISAPIICFASHGDNITPPGQALNWIMDTYASEEEIRVCGQRILYMLHDTTGHLGIFVSSKIANREDVEIAETLAHIEALPPGLYEMTIEDTVGEGDAAVYTLSIAGRTFDDLIATTGDRSEEAAFAAVARGSETLVEAYEATVRPFVVSASSPQVGEAMRKLHPMRQVRRQFTSDHPGMAQIEQRAQKIREARTPADKDNPFRQLESMWGEMVETSWDAWRDMRETAIEMSFLGLYLSPWAMMYGAKRNKERAHPDAAHLEQTPAVKSALSRIEEGGLAAGLIRTLILISRASKQVELDTLTRALTQVDSQEAIQALSYDERRELLNEQTVICTFEPERALATLPSLLSSPQDVTTVLDAVDKIFGSEPNVPPEVFVEAKAIRARLRKEALSDKPKSAVQTRKAAGPTKVTS